MKFLAAVFLLLMSGVLMADVYYEPPSHDKGALIVINGVIGKGDIQSFSNYVDMAKRGKTTGLFIDLDSLGGDVETAILIGYKIRQIEGVRIFVSVRKDAKCASACVFLLAAGPMRWVEGKVGIHRPSKKYDDETSAAGQKAVYRKLEKEIKIFLEAMNISENLYDRMLRIPPEQIHWLSLQELQDYGLNQDDPYYDEAETAKIAKSYGVSKEVYRQIISERQIACANVTKAYWPNCMLNLPTTAK